MSRYVRNPPTPDQIRAERQRAKASVPAAAALVGVTDQTWERYEGGATRMHPGLLELFRLKTVLLHETAARAVRQARADRERAAVISAEAVLRDLLAVVPTSVRYSQEFASRSRAALAQLAHYDALLNGREPPPLQLSPSPTPPPKETDDDAEPDQRSAPAGRDAGARHGRGDDRRDQRGPDRDLRRNRAGAQR